MPKIENDNANEVVKTESESESTGVNKEYDTGDFTEADQLFSDDSEVPEEDITIYLDEFEISRIVMDSAIKDLEKYLNN